MTIRRTLQISNILVVVLPVLIVVIFGFAIEGMLFPADGGAGRQSIPLEWQRRLFFFLLVLAVICVVVCNRLVMRSMMKSILLPLNTLETGVREIRDGNLSYRIQYDKDDEFKPVCEDFNDMAQRLSAMVAQRLADERSRKELVAGISHDLRTPLTSIKAYVEGLEKGVAATPAMQASYLQIVREKTDELDRIIEQLFLFSKLDMEDAPFNPVAQDLGRTFAEMVEGLQEEYRKRGLEIIAPKATPGLHCAVDNVLLLRVIRNILDNSVKYGASSHPVMRIACERDEDQAVLRFCDNGPGVPEESLPKLFEMFYRDDASRADPAGGSGVGLSIAARIIGLHGGAISAHNGEGGGFCLVVTLPIVEVEQS